mgnify:CR=1 FL=1
MGSEKRKYKRRHLIYYLRVFEQESGNLLGHLVDITPEGAMIMSEKRLERGAIYNIKMDLPDEIDEIEHIEFEAKCRWSKKDVNPEFYVSGLEMENIPASKKIVIQKLIIQFGFQN